MSETKQHQGANNETTEEEHISREEEKTITEGQIGNAEGWSSSYSVHNVKEPSDLIQHQAGEQNAIKKTDSPEQSDIPEQDVPYTSFSSWEKRFLVLIATFACFFSPFTTQIYFPAINTIAKDLRVTNSQVNLTVTTYMVSHPRTLLPGSHIEL